MAKFLISAFSDEYDDDFSVQLAALKGYGIDYIELRHADGKGVAEFGESEVRGLKRRLDDFGIKVSSIGSPLGKIGAGGDMKAHAELAKRTFDTAATLGAGYVRIFSFYPEDGMELGEFKDLSYGGIDALLTAANGYPVKLCHENEARIYGESPERCNELLEEFPTLGCVFDMGNFVLDGFDALKAYRLLKDRITYFHIKDSLAAGAVVPPGKGEARIAEILSDYGKRHEDTFVTLEPHLQTFSGLNALVGKSFENPYKYENQRAAFDDAVYKFKGIIDENF